MSTLKMSPPALHSLGELLSLSHVKLTALESRFSDTEITPNVAGDEQSLK